MYNNTTHMHSENNEYTGKPETDLLAHNHMYSLQMHNSIHFVCVHSIIEFSIRRKVLLCIK